VGEGVEEVEINQEKKGGDPCENWGKTGKIG